MACFLLLTGRISSARGLAMRMLDDMLLGGLSASYLIGLLWPSGSTRSGAGMFGTPCAGMLM